MKIRNVYQKRDVEGLTADLQVLTDAITARPIGTTITNSGDDKDKPLNRMLFIQLYQLNKMKLEMKIQNVYPKHT